jgi:hypothetical protein
MGAILLIGKPALSQTVAPNPGGQTVVTNSTTSSYVNDPALAQTVTSQVNQFSTSIQGQLNGKTLYDRSFAAAFSDPVVQAGVAAAEKVLTASGGPGVMIAAPKLVSTTTSTSTSSSSSTVNTNTATGTTAVTTATTFGPETIMVGDNKADIFNVNAGQTDINVNTDIQYDSYILTSVTDTTTTTSLYDIVAQSVEAVGTVHSAVGEAGFDQTERFDRRLLDDRNPQGGEGGGSGSDPNFWVEPYGYYASTAHQDQTPSNLRHGWGLNGGFGYDVTPAFRVGLALDYGHDTISESTAGEDGDLNETQLGLYGSWRSGPWLASLAGTYGWANASTSVTPPGFNETAQSSYAPATASVAAEAGRRVILGNTVLTPSLGAAFEHLQTGSFTETGSALALTGSSTGMNRYKYWLALSSDTSIPARSGVFDLAVYGRAVGIAGDQRVDLPVTFVGSTTALAIQGISTGGFGGDFGTSLGYQLANRVDAYIVYDAIVRDRFASQSGGLGVKVSF